MDTRIVEVRKNVNIFARINTVSSFTAQITNVSFIPDEVIIKGIFYNPDADEELMTTIYVDFLSEVIGSMYQLIYFKPNLHFTLKKPVNQQWTFYIRDVTGSLNATRVGDVSIDLEFVKYAEVKPEKIY